MYQRQVTFSEAVKNALTVNYCNFQGRASRSDFWWFCLFSCIASWVLTIVFCWSNTAEYIVSGLFFLAMLLPFFGLAVRRMHDTGRSGWWVLLSFIPIVCLVFLYFTCQPSQPVPNQWGGVPNLVEE